MARAAEQTLIERDDELDSLRGALAAPLDGRGSIRVVGGPAGCGKSSLLAAARTFSPIRALVARGGELERSVPFATVRDLLRTHLLTLEARRREQVLDGLAGLAAPALGLTGPSPGVVEPFAAIEGLYWLCVNLVEDEPLALLVDDAQWCDEPSLRWLEHLAGRITELPIALLVARRTGPGTAAADAHLDAIAREPIAQRLTPPSLSSDGAAVLMTRRVGAKAAPALVAACMAATGGNPFLLGEVARALQGHAPLPDAAAIGDLSALVSDEVSASVLRRIAAVGDGASELAVAVAVLGARAEVLPAAQLARIDVDHAAELADQLVAADVLAPGRPLQFAHPLLRAAIAESVPPGRWSGLHRRAAQVRAELGEDVALIAAHLLSAEPAADPWAVEQLSAAAREAASDGAPAEGVRFLQRALEEPPAAGQRLGLVRQLGTLETRAGMAAGMARLWEAFDLVEDPRERLELATEIAVFAPFAAEAAPRMRRLVTETAREPAELRARLLATVTIAACNAQAADADWAGIRDELAELAGPGSLGSRMATMALALDGWMSWGAAGEVAAYAWAAVADPDVLAADAEAGAPHYAALMALGGADHAEQAEQRASIGIASAARRGAAAGWLVGLVTRAQLALGCGDLERAREDAALVLEQPDRGLRGPRRRALSVMLDVMRERGELDSAERLIDEHDVRGPLGLSAPDLAVVRARARLALAAGDAERTLEECEVLAAACAAIGTRGAWLCWRPLAAIAHWLSAETDQARALAADHLERARRWGAAADLGAALRVAGLVAAEEDRLVLLRDAVATLEGSRDRIERARALTDLGAELRRGRERHAAREPLGAALDLAQRCSATALAERAREELLACGARPRSPYLSGLEALTVSELRVARLAADGMTNREIAQALFVTPKTVEVHLSRCYRKLDVTGRGDLAARLERA